MEKSFECWYHLNGTTDTQTDSPLFYLYLVCQFEALLLREIGYISAGWWQEAVLWCCYLEQHIGVIV